MDFAIEHEIPYCGWCPKGGWAEDYPDHPGLLRDYPELQETPSSGTEQRTKWNMRDADAILTIIPESSAESKGTEVGLEEGEHLEKKKEAPRLEVDPDKPSYNVRETAVLMDITPDEVRRLIREGKLAAKKYGASYIIRRENISWWLKQQKLFAES